MAATFKEKFYDTDGNAVLIYEYKGYKYEVVDFGWKGGMPLSWQHKNEQTRIDADIERENNPQKISDSESWEPGFSLFWDYVEG